MTILPFPLSANIEGELSETNPFVTVMRTRVAAVLLLFVSLLYPFESFATSCQMNSVLTCQDSTPCKTISGVLVCLATVNPLPAGAIKSAQTCWQAQATYTCLDGTAVNDTCGLLRNNNTCGVISSTCIDTLAATGACGVYTDTYQCQTGGGVAATTTDCSGQTYCANGTCFTKKDKPNNALVKVVTAMELSRQSGFYLDPSDQTIFKGVPQWCSQNNLGLADCCKPEASGKSFSNAVITSELIKMGWNAWVKDVVGSSYSFDTLFDAGTGLVDRAIKGMSEVVNEKVAADSSKSVTTQTTTGSTVTAPPGAGVGGVVGGAIGTVAGSYLVGAGGGNAQYQAVGGSAGYVAGTAAGTYLGAAGYVLVTGGTTASAAAAGSAAYAAICWVCIIAVAVIMLVMALLACEQDEVKTQMKLGANLCHSIGSFCRTKTFLGTCLSTQQNFCCFNSKLAKIVQEQGRPQIGKGWGSPESPECSGFSVDQLQALDFSKMDLSEFFADVVAKANVDADKIKSDIKSRLDNFYAAGTTSNGVITPPPPGTPTTLTVNQISMPVAPVMPACTTSLVKQVPASNGDVSGTFTVTSCLANGLADWVYTGNCTALQGGLAVDTQIDVTGKTMFAATVPAACMGVSSPAFTNQWTARIIDSVTGAIIGKVTKTW